MSVDMTELLDSLNGEQRQAVEAPPCHGLVLAGAGSGKTRVLVHRIAYLIQVLGLSPQQILAVTFTNKASGEMRHRIESLLGVSVSNMWVGTFHSIAHRLLRAHWQQANLSQDFQIIDSEDQLRMVRRILKALNLDEQQWAPRKVQWYINGQKDEGKRPHQLIAAPGDVYTKTLIKLYEAYEQACRQGDLVDFSELLLRARELWLQNPDVLEQYQLRFQYVLVDEFQDTNTVQYAWLQQLVSPQSGNHMMIVGDDDQSIYGWRGAQIENIHRFLRDYPDALTIRLEQNYRSTGTILQASNTLIANNGMRMGKQLWSAGEEGAPIALYAAFNEIDEARFVVDRITRWCEQGGNRRDAAVLYRSNAQSRVLEEALMQAQMPYRVYGGLRFFERAEIKDALAYLRLTVNRDDDTAFERVVNQPARGIGGRTMVLLREGARDAGHSLWQATQHLLATQKLPTRTINALQQFIELIESLASHVADESLDKQTEHVIRHSGLWAHYSEQKGEKAQARLENLEELMNAAKHFSPDNLDEMSPLQAFLSHAALEAGEGQADAYQDCVQLMTLHSAKGLEFPLVFLVGMEEGLFPHAMSIDEPGRLEEERRLCYVGMTRAMQQLIMSYAEVRRQYGKEEHHRPSRFIAELPEECLQEVRHRSTSRSSTTPARRQSKPIASTMIRQRSLQETRGFALGQRVGHAKFGEGVVLNFEGKGDNTRVEVQFSRFGAKWLVLAYAGLASAE